MGGIASTRKPLARIASVLLVIAPVAVVGADRAAAVSPDVVISEVYGGGGNSGATLTHDYIELHNRSAAPVDVSGWSVQYGSAGGTTWLRTNLLGVIPPDAHYLIQQAQGAGGSQPLPAPDAFGSTAMSASSGKVALVTHQTTLTCGAACTEADGLRDLVGYGSANIFEGAPAPGLSNTTSASRDEAGTDTDNNSVDFASGPPEPESTTAGGPQPAAPARIHEIQGAAHRSPLEGQLVEVDGVVTAVSSNGLWFQDPQPDGDPATSEGLFVFTSRAPQATVGDGVEVVGRVAEFRPGGASTDNLSTTEISGARVRIEATGLPLPEPTLVGATGRIAPKRMIDDDATGDETSGMFDPKHDGIDFYESMEGMRVEVRDAVAVGPTNRFGEIAVVPDNGNGAFVRTKRGGIVLRENDANPERIIIDDSLNDTPLVDVGDRFPGSVAGVLDYSFGNFKLLVTSTPTVEAGGLEKEITDPARPGDLTVGTFNVENLSAVSPQAKFDELAEVIVTNLRAPDILAIEEIQDNDGEANTGTVDAALTWERLIDAIEAVGGPTYDWRSINPENNQDGGAPGGNIRVGFLFRTDTGVDFVDRPGGDATTPVGVENVGGEPALTLSPGRIDPLNPAFDDSRKPLAGEFTYGGQTVFVVANHWNSKGGDNPLFGRFQPPVLFSEIQRFLQAEAVVTFVQDVLAIDPNASVIIAGDLNDFPWSAPVQRLVTTTGLVDLPATLPLPERYTYVFDGNSQVLDHILLSPALAETEYEYDVVHVNSEFANQVSDHEPQVARLPF